MSVKNADTNDNMTEDDNKMPATDAASQKSDEGSAMTFPQKVRTIVLMPSFNVSLSLALPENAVQFRCPLHIPYLFLRITHSSTRFSMKNR
jgi:hypothetical protein